MKRRRGHILLLILLVFMLMLALVSGVASTAYLVQRSVDDSTRQHMAQNLGDSVLATAAALLRDDSSSDKFPIAISDANGKAWLTFDPANPQHSTNNILGDGTKEGLDGSTVPAGTAQLVAISEIRGRRFRSQVMLGKSPFPYVVASSGPFVSNNSLLLGALRSLDDLTDGLSSSDLVKGSLLTNSALTINGPGAQVVGDLKTAASTASLPGVQHDGKLEVNAEPEDIPVIPLENYDPAGKPEIIDFNRGPRPNPNARLNLSGLARYQGTLTLNKGLELHGGVLFVEGDLTVADGVTGYGAVFCTGSLRVSGGGELTSDSLCALVAGRDLAISGAGADKTQFRGLVYSAGALSVSDVTVVGSLVGSSASGQSMTVARSNLVFDPAAVTLDLNLQWSGLGKPFGLSGGAMLKPGTTLTPVSLFDGKQFEMPTDAQVRQALLFVVPPNQTPRTWDELSPAEQSEASNNFIIDAKDVISNQIESWNNQGLTPETSSAGFHLDLNRFVKVASRVKILTRAFQRI